MSNLVGKSSTRVFSKKRRAGDEKQTNRAPVCLYIMLLMNILVHNVTKADFCFDDHPSWPFVIGSDAPVGDITMHDVALDGQNLILAGMNNADPVISSAKTSGWVMNIDKDTQATAWLKSTPDNFNTVLQMKFASSTNLIVICKEDTDGYLGLLLVSVTTGDVLDNLLHKITSFTDITRANLQVGTAASYLSVQRGTNTESCTARFASGVFEWGLCATGHRGNAIQIATSDDDWFWGTASSSLGQMLISKFTANVLDYSFGDDITTSDYTPHLMQWKDNILIWATTITEGEDVLLGEIDYSGGIATLPNKGSRSMVKPEVPWDIVQMNAINTQQLYIVARLLDTTLAPNTPEALLALVDFGSRAITQLAVFAIIDSSNVNGAIIDDTGLNGYIIGTSNTLRSYRCDQYLNIYPYQDAFGTGTTYTFGFVQRIDQTESCSQYETYTETTITSAKNLSLASVANLVYTSIAQGDLGTQDDSPTGYETLTPSESYTNRDQWCTGQKSAITFTSTLTDQQTDIGFNFNYDFDEFITDPACTDDFNIFYDISGLTLNGVDTSADIFTLTDDTTTIVSNSQISGSYGDAYVFSVRGYTPDYQCTTSQFTLTVVDFCLTATINAPTNSASTYTVEMFETFSITYNQATSDLDCASINYVLYLEGTTTEMQQITISGTPVFQWGGQVDYIEGQDVLIGSYSLEIYASFADPYTQVSVRSEPFTLTITDPCVTSISQNLQSMTIHVTDNPTDSQNFIEYTDEGQEQFGATAAGFCGADRTYEVVDSNGNAAPDYLSISGNKADGFTLTLSSTDPADYVVNKQYYLRVTYTKPGGTTPIVFDDPFTVTINRCFSTVTAASANSNTYSVEMFDTLSTTWNAASFDTDCGTFQYAFYQAGTTNSMNVANNLPTITFTDDPTYTWSTQVTYSDGDPVLIGNYWVEISAGFASPYTDIEERSTPFYLEVTDPCVTSISQNLQSMYIHVTDQPSATQNFVEYTDEAQQTYGDLATDFCGADRTYEIVDSQGDAAPSYLSISGTKADGFTITLNSDQPSDYVVDEQYNLKVTYTKPGGTSPIVFLDPFTITIDRCFSTLNAPTTDQSEYTIEMFQDFSTTFNAVTFNNDCGTIEYSIYKAGTSGQVDVPAITVSTDPTYTWSTQVLYTTGGPLYLDSYQYEIYASVAAPYTDINVRSSPFTLTVTDPCTTSTSQNLQSMYIHVTDKPTDTQPFTEYTDPAQETYGDLATDYCGADRTYEIVDSSGDPAPGYLTYAGNKVDGYTITLNSEDPSDYVTDKDYFLKVTYEKPDGLVQGLRGTVPVVYQDPFSITIDRCLSTITPPSTDSSEYSVEMFEDFSSTYNPATFTTNCGTLEYSLVQAGTDTPINTVDDVPTFTFTGDPTYTWGASVDYSDGDTIILGSYSVEIYVNFADPYTDLNARSSAFTITITDPCLTSISQNLVSMYIKINDVDTDTQSFAEYTDEGQEEYGSQAEDYCAADRTYEIIDNYGNPPPDYLTISGSKDIGYTLTLNSDSVSDWTNGPVDYYLKVTYPKPDGAASVVFVDPFTIQIDICKIEIIDVEDIIYQLNENEISWSYNVEPKACAGQYTFEAYLVDSEGKNVDLPSFITFDSTQKDQDEFSVYTSNNQDLDTYTVRIIAKIDQQGTYDVSQEFELLVTSLEVDKIYNEKPYFLIPPKDQNLLFDEPLFYNLGEPQDFQNHTITIEVNLSERGEVVIQYEINDDDELIIEIDPNITGAYDEVEAHYLVEIILTDDDEYEPLNNTYRFWINIYKDFLPEDRPEPEPVVIIQPIVDEEGYLINWNPWEEEDYEVIDLREAQEDDPEAPIPKILGLDQYGLLTIEFSKEMDIPENLTDIKPEQVTTINEAETQSEQDPQQQQIVVADRSANFGRNLSTIKLTPEQRDKLEIELKPELELSILPAEGQDPLQLDFTWEVVDFKDRILKIQLYYEITPAISSQYDPDSLQVTFWGSSYFKANDIGIKHGTKVSIPIIRPARDKEQYVPSKYLEVVLKVLLLLYFFATVCVTGRMLPFWAYLNTLQIIAHIVLFTVKIPGNVAVFLQLLLDITRLNFIPYNEFILNTWEGWQEGDAYNEIFNQNGYNSYYCVPNLGLYFLMFAVFTAIYILAFILAGFCKVCGCKKMYTRRPFEKLMFNFNVRFVLEAYLEIALCVVLNMLSLNDNKNEAGFSSLMAIILLAFLVIFYLWIFTLFFKGGPMRIQDEYITYRYGMNYRYKTIYQGMSLMKLEGHTFYPMFFLIQRNFFVFTIIALTAYPVGQIWLLMISSLFMLMVLCNWKPFDNDWWANPLHVFNELILYGLSVCLLYFSQVEQSYINREFVGYSFILAILVWSLINFLIMYCLLISSYSQYIKKNGGLKQCLSNLFCCNNNAEKNQAEDKEIMKRVKDQAINNNGKRLSIIPEVEDPNESEFVNPIKNLDNEKDEQEQLDMTEHNAYALLNSQREAFINLEDKGFQNSLLFNRPSIIPKVDQDQLTIDPDMRYKANEIDTTIDIVRLQNIDSTMNSFNKAQPQNQQNVEENNDIPQTQEAELKSTARGDLSPTNGNANTSFRAPDYNKEDKFTNLPKYTNNSTLQNEQANGSVDFYGNQNDQRMSQSVVESKIEDHQKSKKELQTYLETLGPMMPKEKQEELMQKLDQMYMPKQNDVVEAVTTGEEAQKKEEQEVKDQDSEADQNDELMMSKSSDQENMQTLIPEGGDNNQVDKEQKESEVEVEEDESEEESYDEIDLIFAPIRKNQKKKEAPRVNNAMSSFRSVQSNDSLTEKINNFYLDNEESEESSLDGDGKIQPLEDDKEIVDPSANISLKIENRNYSNLDGSNNTSKQEEKEEKDVHLPLIDVSHPTSNLVMSGGYGDDSQLHSEEDKNNLRAKRKSFSVDTEARQNNPIASDSDASSVKEGDGMNQPLPEMEKRKTEVPKKEQIAELAAIEHKATIVQKYTNSSVLPPPTTAEEVKKNVEDTPDAVNVERETEQQIRTPSQLHDETKKLINKLEPEGNKKKIPEKVPESSSEGGSKRKSESPKLETVENVPQPFRDRSLRTFQDQSSDQIQTDNAIQKQANSTFIKPRYSAMEDEKEDDDVDKTQNGPQKYLQQEESQAVIQPAKTKKKRAAIVTYQDSESSDEAYF